MKRTLITSLVLLLAFVGSQKTYGQYIKIKKKKSTFLLSEEKINVEFTYNDLHFNSDKMTEAQFLAHIDEKIKGIANEEMANKWAEDYHLAKAKHWPETFVNELNKALENAENPPQFIINDTTAQYTLRVHTSWMYFGYDAGITSQNSKVDITLEFLETDNREHLIYGLKKTQARGNQARSRYDNDIHPRPNLSSVENAYLRTGLELAGELKRIF